MSRPSRRARRAKRARHARNVRRVIIAPRHLPRFVTTLLQRVFAGETWAREALADEARLHQWIDRAVILTYAVATGALIVGFTLLAEACHDAFQHLVSLHPGTPWGLLVWTPLCAVAAVAWMRRWAPGTMGSGIPQVVHAAEDEEPGSDVSWLVSLRLSLHKIGLVSLGMLGGLSLGREGPAVQIGAGIMAHARRWLHSDSSLDLHDLMVAGAAAGIAASFNTPLGGIVFALEQLSRRRKLSHSTLVIACIVLAGLVSVSTFGNVSYFGRIRVQDIGAMQLLAAVGIGLACGITGGLFSRLLIASVTLTASPLVRWRCRNPYRFAAACALGVAVIAIITGGATAGTSYAEARNLLEGKPPPTDLYTLLKLCATWLSAFTGVPGGVFAPSLTIGAGLGHDIARLAHLSPEATIPLIALGMAGFLSATTQGPITAFIIVMEMVAGQQMVLSLMACTLVATGVARLFTPPMYVELALALAPPRKPEAPPDEEIEGLFPEARR